MNCHYALVVTSCNRHDLLKQALDSFILTSSVKPRCTIIVEDSAEGQPGWLRDNWHYYSGAFGRIVWLQNNTRRGQVYSIDRAIGEIPKDIELVFWLEDDWAFIQGGYMQQALEILDRYPAICQVVFRKDWPHKLIWDGRFEGFEIAQPYWRGDWGGWTWNPCLTRVSDLKRFGSYASQAGFVHGLKHEQVFSRKFLDAGYRIAALPRHCIHTGGARSRSVEPLGDLPRILLAVPACHAYEYGAWESGDSPSFNKARAYNGEAYGTDIHISERAKDRIAAVRETWAKDAAVFPNVDVRFFYGVPHNREAAADEVFLPCGDTYADLPAKSIAICRYALAQGYDLLVKLDDDTLVYVDKLVDECLGLQADYAGHLNGRMATGGPGYILTKRAFEIVAKHAGSNNHWAEDVTVGKCLFHHDIQPVDLPGHHSGRQQHWFWPRAFDPVTVPDNAVTIHAVQPDVMRDWYRWKLGA